jgi:segregation and condensation protein A
LTSAVNANNKLSYQVELEAFQGPFDLLLDLVSQHKVDIYQIPLSQITSDYLAHLQRMSELDLEIASQFLLVAATLLQIKSSSLLPKEDPQLEAEPTAEEKSQLLLSRLAEYNKFKEAAKSLKIRLETQERYFPRLASLEPKFANLIPDFLENVAAEDLTKLASKLISQGKNRLIDASHIANIRFSIEAKINQVMAKLAGSPRQTFKALVENSVDREEIIATFLALLELYKRGQIALRQFTTFGEIEVTSLEL